VRRGLDGYLVCCRVHGHGSESEQGIGAETHTGRLLKIRWIFLDEKSFVLTRANGLNLGPTPTESDCCGSGTESWQLWLHMSWSWAPGKALVG
jgi:hypothetical protein